MIIAIEGIDACGKETQVALLREYFDARDLKNVVLEFPHYQSSTGRKIKELLLAPERDPLVLQSLMTVNRYESSSLIKQFQATNHTVILDRYWLSGLIYGQTDGLDRDWLWNVHEDLPQPDLWILLDIPVAESFKRRPHREDAYEASTKRLCEARNLYLAEARNLRKSSIVLVQDGTSSVDTIAKNIIHNIITIPWQ